MARNESAPLRPRATQEAARLTPPNRGRTNDAPAQSPTSRNSQRRPNLDQQTRAPRDEAINVGQRR